MFWDVFVSLCLARSVTPSEVVRELGIAMGSVTKWKNGSIPSQKNLIKIADYFGTTVGRLMGYATNEEEYSPEKKQLFDSILALTDSEVEQLSEYIDFIISKRSK